MEGTMGEIRLFAANFAPKTWAYCQGQLLPINQNQALFSILGTTYGGDGVTTFGLPDLRGRTCVGQGQGPNLSFRTLGEKAGEATHTLITSEMPIHTHASSLTTSANVAMGCLNDTATTESPEGNYIASIGQNQYAPTSNGVMGIAPASVTVNMQVGVTGASQPHQNMQPYLGIGYVICLQGIYPSRN
ncbi:MAG: tail fiber protein [Bacteroidota bacterium]